MCPLFCSTSLTGRIVLDHVRGLPPVLLLETVFYCEGNSTRTLRVGDCRVFLFLAVRTLLRPPDPHRSLSPSSHPCQKEVGPRVGPGTHIVPGPSQSGP